MNVLSLQEVCVRRGGRCLLDGVSLALQAGEILGIVGASGAGKSTLLRVALGLEAADSGEVSWGDVSLTSAPKERLRAARRHLGAVFQHPAASLDPRRTLLESLSEPMRTHEPDAAARFAARVEEMLVRVGLPAHYAMRRPTQLSGGEAQRAAIGRALILRPALCLFDEPTSALDPATTLSLLRLIAELNRTLGTAFLFVSHDLAAIAFLCTRLAVLHEGRIVETGPMAECFATPRSDTLRGLLGALGSGAGE